MDGSRFIFYIYMHHVFSYHVFGSFLDMDEFDEDL